jgi:aminoglycoside 6'-N-acetyltransferase
VDESGADTFAIVADGAVAGCIQYSEETDPDYFSAAVDIFVGTAAQGRGVGPDAMRTLIAWLLDVLGHHRLTVDPAAENERAVHVYEKLGFRRVGVLRQYERVEDGTWRDALLMELLADEFVR